MLLAMPSGARPAPLGPASWRHLRSRSSAIVPVEERQPLALGRLHRHHGVAALGSRLEVGAGGEQLARRGVERRDELVQLRDMPLHPRLHRGEDGRDDQVDGGLLAAAHAGAVAAHHRAVGGLLEQQRRQDADPLVDVRHVDEAVVGVGEPLPDLPVAPQLRQRGVVLPDRHQRAIGTHVDAEVAALAGLGVDRDREQPAGALRLPLRPRRRTGGSAPAETPPGAAARCPNFLVGGGPPLGVPTHLAGHGLRTPGQTPPAP